MLLKYFHRLEGWFVSILTRRLRVVYQAFVYMGGRESTVLVSSIAFSFMVSVFPFIILLVTLSHYLNWEEFRETIFGAFHTFFPVSQDFIIRNLKIYTQKLGALHVVSFVLLAWGISVFFFSLEAGLDSAYRVPSYRKFIRSQFLGTVMAIGLGVGVFLFLAVFRAAQVFSRQWVELGAQGQALVDQAVGFVLAVALTVLTFLAVFRWLPNRRQSLGRIWPETVLASAIWLPFNLIFRLLAPLWHLQDIYGPFYVSITLLLWAFGSASIVLFCARLAVDGFFKPAPRLRPEEPPAAPEWSADRAAMRSSENP